MALASVQFGRGIEQLGQLTTINININRDKRATMGIGLRPLCRILHYSA